MMFSDSNGYFLMISFVNTLLIGPRFPQPFWPHRLWVQFTRCILIHQQTEIEIMPIYRFLWMSMLVLFKDAYIGCLFIRYWTSIVSNKQGPSHSFLKYMFYVVKIILPSFREMMDLLERITFTMECTSERFLSSFKKLPWLRMLWLHFPVLCIR